MGEGCDAEDDGVGEGGAPVGVVFVEGVVVGHGWWIGGKEGFLCEKALRNNFTKEKKKLEEKLRRKR